MYEEQVLEEDVAPKGSTLELANGLGVKLVVPPFPGVVVRGVLLAVAEVLLPTLFFFITRKPPSLTGGGVMLTPGV